MDGTTSTTSTAAEDEKMASATQGAEPQLLATAVGDTCANCGARLAGDQRYCVECGTRRGKPRYAVPTTTTMTTTTTGAPGGYRATRWGWMSSNASLILGVGVLLLAMGVGVLIGHDTAGTTSSGKAQVITVNGASSGGAAAPTTTPTTPATTAGTGSSTPKSSSTSNSAATAKTKSSPVTAAAKLPAKLKVIPKTLQSKVKTVGQKCASGPGCTGGKFTGTFFGGG